MVEKNIRYPTLIMSCSLLTDSQRIKSVSSSASNLKAQIQKTSVAKVNQSSPETIKFIHHCQWVDEMACTFTKCAQCTNKTVCNYIMWNLRNQNNIPIYLHRFTLFIPVITLSCIIAKPSDIFRYNHDE